MFSCRLCLLDLAPTLHKASCRSLRPSTASSKTQRTQSSLASSLDSKLILFVFMLSHCHISLTCLSQNVLASSIVGLDRISSSSCIRSLQVATANSFSVESEAIYAEHPSVPKSFEYSPTHALTVALPRECSPHFLESSMWRALRGSDVRNDVTLTRVVHLALPASGEDLGDDDDVGSTPDVVSIDEIESFHTKLGLSESNVPRPAASACVAFGQHSVIDEALSTVNMETVHNMKQDQCAPHAVLAGYAKCATSTLQYDPCLASLAAMC